MKTLNKSVNNFERTLRLGRQDAAKFECNYCQRKFIWHTNSKIHEFVHTLKNDVPKNDINSSQLSKNCCKKIQSKTTNISEYKTLKENLLEICNLCQTEPFQCEECGLRFRSTIEVNEHRNTHYRERSWRCVQCPKIYSLKYNLQKHERIHQWIDSIDVHDFDMKNLIFENQPPGEGTDDEWNTLARHDEANDQFDLMEPSGRQIQGECDICVIDVDETTVNSHAVANSVHETAFNGHGTAFKGLESTENSNENTVLSSLVPVIAISDHAAKPILAQRAKSIKSSPIFQCYDCKKNFNSKRALKRHQLIHSEVKRFKCDQCVWAFRRAEHLRRHQLIHTKEKPFTCTHCGKAFNRKDKQKLHERRHCSQISQKST